MVQIKNDYLVYKLQSDNRLIDKNDVERNY